MKISTAATLGAILLASGAHATTLARRGEYRSGAGFAEGGAEIVAHRAWTDALGPHLRAYVVNGANKAIDLVDLDDPSAPTLSLRVDLASESGSPTDGPTSVAVDPRGRGIAVALPAWPRHNPGWIVFLDPDGARISSVVVGAVPDMITFTRDGSRLLVANEGEPKDDYTIDPEGSVAIIDTDLQFPAPTARFARFLSVPEIGVVRHFGPNALDPARDFEPEYIAIDPNGQTAYVSLQENNAIAVLDLVTETFLAVHGLGYKDHNLPGNGIDASDKDAAINIRNYPLFGMYQPDSLAAFASGGKTFLVTANEGDQREYLRFNEAARVEDLTLEAPLDPALRSDVLLGRLTVTTTLGDDDGDNRFEALYAFGGRSFSVFEAGVGLTMAYDSGDGLEQTMAALDPAQFNCSNDSNTSFDDRSDNKGPEPEGMRIARVCGQDHLFLGLERISGVMVYDLGDPQRPAFLSYATSRDFTVSESDPAAGGIGPEGLDFVPAAENPAGENLLLVANEMSGTLDVWAIVCPVGALPPRDVGNTLKAVKSAPTAIALQWDDAPIAPGYELALTYEIHTAITGCGPYALGLPPVARVPGINQASVPLLPSPALELFSIVSRNPADTSNPLPPDGGLCR